MKPRLEIDLDSVGANARKVVNLGADKGVEIWGVTKGAAADLKVAHQLVDNGVAGLADSRLHNLKKLADLDIPLMMLRIPQLSEAEEVVTYADISLNSELEVIRRLNQAAKGLNCSHKVVLMVDLGDRREGLLSKNLLSAAAEVQKLDNIILAGLGTNLACFRGVCPTQKLVAEFGDLVEQVQSELGSKLDIVTAGNSSSLPLLVDDDFTAVSNCYRIGETILLGREVPDGSKFALTEVDTFTLVAEVIEVKEKPTAVSGGQAENAFGEEKQIVNKGVRKRAILAVGRQDIAPQDLIPIKEGITIEGASSDHLVVDVTEAEEIELGAEVKFRLQYGALLRAMTSPYVEKRYCR